MIMTILKQTTTYYLDEKDFEVANVYADLYSKTVVQFVNHRKHAITALKDLAYEFFINGLLRNAQRYYLMVKDHYGITALNDKDLLSLAEIQEKLNHHDDALENYHRILRFYPHSHHLQETYKGISRICEICGNRTKAEFFKSMFDTEIFPMKKA